MVIIRHASLTAYSALMVALVSLGPPRSACLPAPLALQAAQGGWQAGGHGGPWHRPRALPGLPAGEGQLAVGLARPTGLLHSRRVHVLVLLMWSSPGVEKARSDSRCMLTPAGARRRKGLWRSAGPGCAVLWLPQPRTRLHLRAGVCALWAELRCALQGAASMECPQGWAPLHRTWSRPRAGLCYCGGAMRVIASTIEAQHKKALNKASCM